MAVAGAFLLKSSKLGLSLAICSCIKATDVGNDSLTVLVLVKLPSGFSVIVSRVSLLSPVTVYLFSAELYSVVTTLLYLGSNLETVTGAFVNLYVPSLVFSRRALPEAMSASVTSERLSARFTASSLVNGLIS